MESQELVFEFDRTTKNTVRYKEVAGDMPPVIGTLYVQRWALSLPVPQRLAVSISDAPDALALDG
jgi:hypothetical protein